MDWSGLGLGEVAGCREHGIGTAGSKRCGEFRDCEII
jgi:hypothetical protein